MYRVRLQPGEFIHSRFRLLSLLGQGDQGQVFRAQDTVLEKTVVLKFLGSGQGRSPESLARLRREGDVLKNRVHPALPRCMDAVLDHEPPFLIFESVAGVPLDKWVQDSSTGSGLLAIVTQIASALDAVHASGYVHRDIKPQNIVVAPSLMVGDSPRGYLIDFGSVGPLQSGWGSEESEITRITRTGVAVGSPLYMAPEVWAGRAACSASDQYALGWVVFESLFGFHPYAGMMSIRAVGTKHMEGDFTIPKENRWGRTVSPRVSSALRRALHLHTFQRFPSCFAFAQELTIAGSMRTTEVFVPESGNGSAGSPSTGESLGAILLSGLLLATHFPTEPTAFQEYQMDAVESEDKQREGRRKRVSEIRQEPEWRMQRRDIHPGPAKGKTPVGKSVRARKGKKRLPVPKPTNLMDAFLD